MATPPRTRSPSPPRELPSAERELVDEDVLVEEEGFSWYDPDAWYPVKIGDVFQSRYQVLLKLGFGSVSTAWLCRDLIEHKYVTVKIYETGHRQSLNEFKVLEHLGAITSDHRGRRLVRLALGSFELPGNKGPHVCIVHEPLGLSLADIRQMVGGKLPGFYLKPMVYGMLFGLDFLHSVAHVVHTDLQEGNIMLSIKDPTMLDEAVEEEWSSPTPYKVCGHNPLYFSAVFELPDGGNPIISDFGDAQFGEPPFRGEVMPDLYRAPEIILGIAWDEKIDIWSFGLMVWHLFEGESLFKKRLPSREESSPAHLARMISLLGPPPPDILPRGAKTSRFFEPDGTFKFLDLVSDTVMETEEKNLEGQEKEEFLAFVRRMLQWRPEDRPSASELLKDPWLRGLRKDSTQTL